MTTRIALLGAGRIGQVHARAIASNPSARLVAVADAMPAAAEKLAADYGVETATIGEIAANDDVDAVAICTPTDTHADLIEQFARAGKAVFCEKPIALDIERVRQCLDVVDQSGVLFMVGFNRRFDPHFRALKAAIDEGRIGTVEQVAITSRDPGLPPREYIPSSGGLFRDMTIHDFDMARFLVGEPFIRVMATASALVDPTIRELGDYDTATIILVTASGRQVSISNSRRASYGYDQRIEVTGDLGMIAAENQRPASIELANADGFTRPPLYDFFMSRYVDAYRDEIGSFIAAATGARPVEVSGADGLAALELAQAAERSVRENRMIDL
ncbi:inositol 2-dehydrogenase [Cucumibacter marinus]|uniref:inositol 2-dehydrogenase n=1 Tax=Cucumibacter marinus TaxID=1121252 RepID=UPI000409D548|nr:inositol 2-dehydrogenase [Cucumibacter marinus]